MARGRVKKVENVCSIAESVREVSLAGPLEAPGRAAEGRPPENEAAAQDAALAAGCRAGRLSAFEQLYHSHGARMRSIARNLLGSNDAAEDAVQEAFLKIHRSMAGFKGGSAFSTWAVRILINTCYDELRRRRRTPQPQEAPERSDDAPATEPAAPRHDLPLRLRLERSLERLRPQHRSVFLLFEVEGFSHAEMAAALGISVANSKNILFQAKRELREMIRAARGGAE